MEIKFERKIYEIDFFGEVKKIRKMTTIEGLEYYDNVKKFTGDNVGITNEVVNSLSKIGLTKEEVLSMDIEQMLELLTWSLSSKKN